jgi:hypothetical protein
MSAPMRLWRMGPPFSWRHTFGSLVCIAIGHHAPRLAQEVWNPEHRTWGAISETVHAAVCSRCGRNLAYRIHEMHIR